MTAFKLLLSYFMKLWDSADRLIKIFIIAFAWLFVLNFSTLILIMIARKM